MQHKKLRLIALLLFGLGVVTAEAQNSISSTGGNGTGEGGTISYSAGQVVYCKYTGTNGSASQGVQQPFEISVITGLDDARLISLEFTVYPNPVSDNLKLKIENYEIGNLRYQLFDINGNILQNNKVEGNETNISTQNLLPATYILKIVKGNQEIKTFKIIKNN